jgi:hypothetical protein
MAWIEGNIHMIKLEVHPQVLMSLSQAFPTPNMAATKALNKYVQVLEKLLFESWLRGPTPEQRKLKLFGLSLYQLMTKGGQIGPNKIRIHKWLKDQKLELVQAVTKGSNLTGRLSEVKLTNLVTMTNTLELEEEMTMYIHNKTDREISAYLTGDDQANQSLFDLLYPDYDERWSEEFILNLFDPIQVDATSLESYIVWLTTEATKLTKDKKAAALRQARIILGSSKAFNGWYLQRKKPSDFGRMYYEGVSVQNVNKELRRAMLGNCWEYDIRSSVIAWKMGFAEQYLKSSGLEGDIRHTFPATLNYLEDKADFMRTVRLYVFDDHSKESGEFHMKLLKQAFTAMSFGARLASTGWQDQSGHWNNPALVNILKNTQERNRFFNDRSVRAFIKEQNTLDDFLFKEFRTHHPELVKLPYLLTHSGRLSKAKVLAYLYQHGETKVMDIFRTVATANECKPIANVHDAIFFKRRLGVELKSEIECQMRSQTGNPYWHLTAKELKRYEPRHLDVIAEESAHKRRIAAEHAAALHSVPTIIAQLDISQV